MGFCGLLCYCGLVPRRGLEKLAQLIEIKQNSVADRVDGYRKSYRDACQVWRFDAIF
jgi:hypothetical protein